MANGYDVLEAFALVTPLLGKIIGRPFAMTASREFDYRKDPDAAILDEMRETYRSRQGGDYEDFRDAYREGYGIRAFFAHFSGVDDYMMEAPEGRTSMRDFIMPPRMKAGGIEIASSARTAMFRAIKTAKPHSTVLPARVLGAPLLSYAFPVFDGRGVLVGGVSFGIDISHTVTTAHQLRLAIESRDDEALRKLSAVLGEELEAASAVALALRRQAEQTRGYARSIQSRSAEIGEVAEQLSVLAINTAIEAARAGGSGKGVGVIAKKMKEISEATSQTVEGIHAESAKLDAGAKQVLEGAARLSEGEASMRRESGVLATTAERLVEQKKGMERLIEASVEAVADSKQNLDAIYDLIPNERAEAAAPRP